MKTIKLYVSIILVLFSVSSLFAQDEIYNEKPRKVVVIDSNQIDELIIVENDSTRTDSITKTVSINNIEEYSTEDDYYEENYGKQKEEELRVYTEEDVPEGNRQRRNAGGDVAVAVAEVVLEVFFNVVFFFALGH